APALGAARTGARGAALGPRPLLAGGRAGLGAPGRRAAALGLAAPPGPGGPARDPRRPRAPHRAAGMVRGHRPAGQALRRRGAGAGATLGAVPAELLGSVFSDSLEVYQAGWTAALPEHFRSRRGYDLLPVLHLLEIDAPGAAQVREDYGRTLSELVEEGF